jgi:hypothetical protein
MNRSLILLALLALPRLLPAEWYDDTWADPEEKRKNTHSGNLVQTTFYNTGLVGRVGPEFSFEWPKGTGDEYIGDISVCVGVEYFNRLLNEPIRSVAVTQSPARGNDEVNPADPSDYWTFMPLPGFANPDTSRVAMSHQRYSWPDVWPDKGWPGSWNGYFGRDVLNADQESYFWIDDSRDDEFLSKEWAYRDTVDTYFPGLWSENFPENPDSALVRRIQPFAGDSLHGGLGLKVAVRGFQWSHVLAEDVIFWLYDITNISDIDYDKVVFGMVCGTLVGGDGDSGDDINWFDRDAEFTFTGDSDDRGATGWVPVHPGVRNVGYVGYAFLESPGNNVDWIDNDGDSQAPSSAPRLTAELLNEWLAVPRVLEAGEDVVAIDYNDPWFPRYVVRVPEPGDTLVFNYRNVEVEIYAGKVVVENPANLIDDNFNGIIDENYAYEGAAYIPWQELGLDLSPLENGEWVYIDPDLASGYDLLVDERRDDGIDNDGDWDPEYDDVGGDGQPGTGDLGEGDGLPTAGEPHFDALDITESDQLGLTSFNEFTFPEFRSRNDEDIWRKMIPGEFDSTAGTPADVDFLYGAGYFPLRAGETQRISLAVVFGESEADLYTNLETVRTIYNENYNFIQPPAKPQVQAVAGDGEVTLYWDDKAEESVDRISKLKDFEGYRIYRATDPGFLDAYNITDGYGNAAGFAPIAQFDLINEIEGFFPEDLNGTSYYLGNNSGLVHSFTDTTVVNGQRYFYAVTSYDRGDVYRGLLPAECAKQVTVEVNGLVTLDVNTVEVIPTAPAAGYIPGLVMDEAQHLSGNATGSLLPVVVDERQLVDGAVYDISLIADTTAAILDLIEWQITEYAPSERYVFDPDIGGYVVVEDSIAVDSVQVLAGSIDVEAVAWTMTREGLDPAIEVYAVNANTPQQLLHHPGVHSGSLVATRLDTDESLQIRYRVDTGELINAAGAFDFDFEAGKVIFTPEFLATLPVDELVEVMFVYDYNLVHKQLVPNLTGYATQVQAYLPVVEGVQVNLRNDWYLQIDAAESGWENAAENIMPWSMIEVALLNLNQVFNGVSQPRDYRIDWLEDASGGLSLGPDDFPNQAMTVLTNRIVPSLQTNYRIWDITDPENPVEKRFFIYNAKLNEGNPATMRDPLAPFDYRDAILIAFEDETSPSGWHVSWLMQSGSAYDADLHVLPTGGESYTAMTKKPFTDDDSYRFSVAAPSYNPDTAREELADVKVVPNPYLATAAWEARPIKGNRGDRKIQFIHLPPQATVKIFTIRGELVQTLHHDEDSWDGSLDWNLKSREGLDVAYGMYLYHVDSPAGEKTGKFALIK